MTKKVDFLAYKFNEFPCRISNFDKILFTARLSKIGFFTFLVQVNLCQKLSFLHQLTHNMTTDCSWNYHENYKCSAHVLHL